MECNISKIGKIIDEEIRFICEKHLETPSLWIEGYSFTDEEVLDEITRFVNIFNKGKMVTFIATHNNKIIGFVWAEFVDNDPEDSKIISLWVDPDYRNQGIATKLKKKLEENLKISGVKKLRTNVYAPNKQMLDLNLKLGYRIIRYDMLKDL
ncbi:MAG: GNAT family N-acetyltransferase [Candidatus Delongbacteria bacterium]|nr:GNAT family N-acetyltransferase [Candidatus Delongbacteria bacterium]MBN2834217.1 GNAT family N-acetyltransferase [Candidatus Delongbacteria bacterium]